MVFNKDMHVMMFAASGRGMLNLVSNLLAAEDVTTEKDSKPYNPTEVTQPTAEYEGPSGSEKADLAATSLGVLAATKGTTTLLRDSGIMKMGLKEIVQEGAFDFANAGAGKMTFIAGEGAVLEESGKLGTALAKSKVGAKVAAKLTGSIFLKVGAKLVTGPVGWAVTIGTTATGGYQIFFGEKPFTSKVLLIESDKVGELCKD
jgi:hypothetical protein